MARARTVRQARRRGVEALNASVPAFIGEFVIVDCRFDYAGCQMENDGK